MNDLPEMSYFDLTLKNYSNDTDNKQQLRFAENRQTDIISDCSQYNMSIVRFDINTSSLPVYCGEILHGSTQTDPNKMLASITMEIYRGNAGSTVYCTDPTHLTWVPQDLSVEVPKAPSDNADRAYLQSPSEYYFCYNYEHLLKIVNKTLADLTASLVSFDAYFADIPPPFMAWSTESNSAVIYCKQNIFSTDRVYPSPSGDKEIYVKIYFNRALYNLFSTFYFMKQDPHTMQVYKGQLYNPLKMHYQLMLDSVNDTNVLQSINSNIQPLNRYLQIKQMISTVSAINCVSAILFTSDTIPVIPQNVNKPNLLLNNNVINYQRSGFQDNYANIISDFCPGPTIPRSDMYYVPEGQNRYISLTNNKQVLRQLDINVSWRDSFGIVWPFYLNSGGQANLKILFEKKKYL